MLELAVMGVLGGGLLGGLFNAFGNIGESNRRQAEIDRQKQQVSQEYNQYMENLEFSFNDTMNQLDKSYSSNRTQWMNTSDARSMESSFASTSSVMQSQNEYAELALSLAQAEQTVGSAIQSQATTGFRNTGSNTIAQAEAERITGAKIGLMRNQIKLTQAQRFQQASTNYFSQSAMMDSIKTNMDNILAQKDTEKNRYEMNKTQAKDRYDLQIKHLNQQRDDYEYSGFDMFLDVTSGLLGGITNAFSTFWK